MQRKRSNDTVSAPAEPSAASPAAPRGCTSLKLRQLNRRVSRHYDAIVGATGLKTTQYSLLSHLVALGPVRPGALAAALQMDASTLTRNLQPLAAAGWVETGAGDDGRSRLVGITAPGRAKRAEAQRAWKRAQLALNDRLGLERVARLHALADECLRAMDQIDGGDAGDGSDAGISDEAEFRGGKA